MLSNDDRGVLPSRSAQNMPGGVAPTPYSSAFSGRIRAITPTALIEATCHAFAQLWEQRDPLDATERRLIIDKLFPSGVFQHQFLARFSALMLLSTAIAALGILGDSTAVVIGAMLLAPLMVPVLGVAAAMVMGWPFRIVSYGSLVALGAVLAVLFAGVISFVIPGTDSLSAELIARTSPNLLDLGIALAAGVAGAYSETRRHAADALTGVAVAVALVPPLAVVGITLQMTEWQLAVGALLLFLANVIGIVISAAFTFLATGFVPGRSMVSRHTSIGRGVRWAAVAVIVLVLPMQFGRGNMLPPTDPTDEVTVAVEDFIEEDGAAAEVVDVAVEVAKGIVDVDVILASSATSPRVTALARHLAEQLSAPVSLSMHVVSTETERATVIEP